MADELSLVDYVRAGRAIATNQFARLFPKAYVRLIGETGRGKETLSALGLAGYYRQCFDDYMRMLGVPPDQCESFLSGKTVLEYGPGDIPGVALLFVAHGAQNAVCVDRFPLLALEGHNVEVVGALLDSLPPKQRARAAGCFKVPGDCRSGLRSERIDYRITADGLVRRERFAALVISRAVLEHVNNLPETFVDMRAAMTPDGIAIHQVDLASHGLHRSDPLDFLTWPEWLWDAMFSHKGAPNRHRVDTYRRCVAKAGLEALVLEPTKRASVEDVRRIKQRLAGGFRDAADEDLAWLGFWLVCRPANA